MYFFVFLCQNWQKYFRLKSDRFKKRIIKLKIKIRSGGSKEKIIALNNCLHYKDYLYNNFFIRTFRAISLFHINYSDFISTAFCLSAI